MADDEELTINELLAKYPELFKVADSPPGQASSSRSGGSAAQAKTSNLERGQSQDPKMFDTLEGSVNASNNGEDNVGESERAIPDEFAEHDFFDGYIEGRPGFSDGIPAFDLDEFTSGYDFDTRSGSLSKSEGKKPEPRQAETWKFEEEYSKHPDQDTTDGLSDLLHKLPTSSEESSPKRSISPPLFQAIAQRILILSHQKPGASGLRNEIPESPVDDDRQASESLEYDGTVGNGFEYTGQLTATLVERPIPNENGLIPPIINWDESSEYPRFFLQAPGPSAFGLAEPRDVKIREADAGLSADEWAKVPNEFRHLDQHTLARFWDFAYNPVIRQTVLNYKRDSALAGEVLDFPNELLVALVDIQEAARMEGAKHIAGETVEDRKASMLMKRRRMKAEAARNIVSGLPHESTVLTYRDTTDGAREGQIKELEQKQAVLVSQMRAGFLSVDQFFDGLKEHGEKLEALREEARLKVVGGRVADMLVERQKKMAVADGAPDWLLP